MPRVHLPNSARREFARSCQRGVGLVEMLLALVVLAVAILGYASLVLAQHGVGHSLRIEGQMLQVAREFMERLRADDWADLYAELCSRHDDAQAYPAPDARLADGRHATSPSAYYPDFLVPLEAASLRVLVDVPRNDSKDYPGYLVLREDVAAPRFGLPADLNADGKIDDERHDTDYVVLPVEVSFLWAGHGGRHQEFHIRTWLTGDR